MSLETHESHVEAVIDLINQRRRYDARTVIAIAGPPASGKTTLADSVVRQLNLQSGAKDPVAALLPMDGYHLDNNELEQRGMLARKGAVETFDQDGFCSDLAYVSVFQSALSLPSFDRQHDRVIPDSIHITADTQIIVTEGNYLLLDQLPWVDAVSHYTATVFVEAPLSVLRDRLMERWAVHGLSRDMAIQKIEHNDLPNARLVLDSRQMADLTISHNVHDALPVGGEAFAVDQNVIFTAP